MKRLLTLIIAAVALQSCSLSNLLSYPQPHPTGVTINIDIQPAWGPIGYDYAAYYYMPEINIYYDINHSRFYYHTGGRWVAAEYLPPAYRIYDLYKIYKVVLNYDSPWDYNRTHRSQYRHYRDDRTQVPIRMSNDVRYQKSWSNMRPWVDPDRRNNRENDYYLRTQNQQSGSNKYIEENHNNGYRVEGNKQQPGTPAGGSYRTKENKSDKGAVSSSSSYRNQQKSAIDKRTATDQKSAIDKKPATDQKSAIDKKPAQDSKPKQPTSIPSASSSYQQQNKVQSQPASNGVSSRGKVRTKVTTDTKVRSNNKSSTTKSSESSKTRSSKSSTDKSASSPSPSASYRSGNTATTTSSRGR